MAKIKVKRSEIVAIHHAFRGMGEIEGNPKFTYAVSKNKKLILPEIEALADAEKLSPELVEYDKKRISLCEKYCNKDENGKPITVPLPSGGTGYDGLGDDNKKFTDAIGKLQAEYKDVLDARQKQMEKVNELLDEEIEIEVHCLKVDDLPNLKQVIVEVLMPILVDE